MVQTQVAASGRYLTLLHHMAEEQKGTWTVGKEATQDSLTYSNLCSSTHPALVIGPLLQKGIHPLYDPITS
jgi:hypothetical protein